MKRLITIIALITVIYIPVVVFGQATQQVIPMMFADYDNTTDMNSTDTSQLFTTAYSAAKVIRHGGSAVDFTKVKAVWCTIENADIRVAFGSPAKQGATILTGLGHVISVGQSFRFPVRSKVSTMRFISKTASTPARLQCSLEY